jgi:hypothetical protein
MSVHDGQWRHEPHISVYNVLGKAKCSAGTEHPSRTVKSERFRSDASSDEESKDPDTAAALFAVMAFFHEGA